MPCITLGHNENVQQYINLDFWACFPGENSLIAKGSEVKWYMKGYVI